jgi:hypothetical protein
MLAGAAGGVAGGVVFGAMMQAMDMIPMVAMLVDSESIGVGWVIHLVISTVLGAGFGVVAARLGWGLAGTAAGGAAYGFAWWVLGALWLMPAALGMPTFTFDTMAWRSLAGHGVFGLILGAAVALMTRGTPRAGRGGPPVSA